MLDSVSIIFFTLWVLVVALFSYAAYWAFIIRKALVTGLYRRQALWAGTMGLYFVALSTFLTIALSFNLTTLLVNILGGLLISSGFIVLFAWIDSTVRVARRSDPLLRDTFRWSTTFRGYCITHKREEVERYDATAAFEMDGTCYCNALASQSTYGDTIP